MIFEYEGGLMHSNPHLSKPFLYWMKIFQWCSQFMKKKAKTEKQNHSVILHHKYITQAAL